MTGEEYQPDVLHPAWAPGAVVPLPSYTPEGYVQYTLQYDSADSNGDFFTPPQPQARAQTRWDGMGSCRRRLGPPRALPPTWAALDSIMNANCVSVATAFPPLLLQMEPVRFRAKSWLEASPDLQQPQVGGSVWRCTTCTAPQYCTRAGLPQCCRGAAGPPACMRLPAWHVPLDRHHCLPSFTRTRPKQYDNATIPIVFHPTWQYNYAHVATASLAWIYNNVNQSNHADIQEHARQAAEAQHGDATGGARSVSALPGEPVLALPPLICHHAAVMRAGLSSAHRMAGPWPPTCSRCCSRCCASRSPHLQSETPCLRLTRWLLLFRMLAGLPQVPLPLPPHVQAEPAPGSRQHPSLPSLLLPHSLLQQLRAHLHPKRLERSAGGCRIVPAAQRWAAAAAAAAAADPAAGAAAAGTTTATARNSATAAAKAASGAGVTATAGSAAAATTPTAAAAASCTAHRLPPPQHTGPAVHQPADTAGALLQLELDCSSSLSQRRHSRDCCWSQQHVTGACRVLQSRVWWRGRLGGCGRSRRCVCRDPWRQPCQW